jgi:HPt (histidine-containing phosphotransfer) domain-containing protein
MLNGLAEAQGEGEPDLIVELIDLYLSDTPPRVDAMREALANGDHVKLGRAAHSLKGSSSTLGAIQVAASCAELEVLARELSLTSANPVLERLYDELASLRETFLIERQERIGQSA